MKQVMFLSCLCRVWMLSRMILGSSWGGRLPHMGDLTSLDLATELDITTGSIGNSDFDNSDLMTSMLFYPTASAESTRFQRRHGAHDLNLDALVY